MQLTRLLNTKIPQYRSRGNGGTWFDNCTASEVALAGRFFQVRE